MIVKNSDGHYLNLDRVTEFCVVQREGRALKWCIIVRDNTEWFGDNGALLEDFESREDAQMGLDWLMNQMVMGRIYVDMSRDYFDNSEDEGDSDGRD